MVNKPLCGIYRILNLINGKFYLGSSCNLGKRWVTHRSLLRRNKHENRYLQFAWNKYGESCFRFEIICEVAEEKLIQTEQIFLDAVKCYEMTTGYNLAKYAAAAGKNVFFSEERKTRLSLSMTGKGNPFYGRHHTAETKAKISAAKKGCSSHNKGKSLSQETRVRISVSKKGHPSINKGKPMSEEQKAKMKSSCPRGIQHHSFGKPMSEAAKTKLRETRKARRLLKQTDK